MGIGLFDNRIGDTFILDKESENFMIHGIRAVHQPGQQAFIHVTVQVIGNDITVTMAAEAGQLELNV
jgi:hypothetical protein